MNKKDHYLRLEKMYLSAPINKHYNPSIDITEVHTKISMDVKESFFSLCKISSWSCLL